MYTDSLIVSSLYIYQISTRIPGPFNFILSSPLSNFVLALGVANGGFSVGPQNKTGHPARVGSPFIDGSGRAGWSLCHAHFVYVGVFNIFLVHLSNMSQPERE